jgi:8-oxo-dGTP diphosphatase
VTYSYEFPKADITVDCVLFGFNSEQGRLEVVLIRRGEDPFQGRWALPGGFIEFGKGETAYEAARREMQEETGVTVDYLEQLMTFDTPDRDPRGRTFSVAHWALVRSQDHTTTSGSDAAEARWMPVIEALALPDDQMAFDHKHILRTAVERLQNKVRYTPLGFNLLPEKFTLSQLQKLYEAILFREIDKRNFRKRIHGLDVLEELEFQTVETGGRPAQLYQFDKAAYDQALKTGFNFEI